MSARVRLDVRRDFPILQKSRRGPPLVYLDNAATTLKPNAVIDAVADFYRSFTSNVSRGNHRHAETATIAFEGARERVASLIGAKAHELVFALNTTDAINQAASMLRLGGHDLVVDSAVDHHSNHLPWLERCRVVSVGIDRNGLIDRGAFMRALSRRPKLVALNFASNVTGAVQPVRRLTALARKAGALTLVDAAQAVGHIPIAVQELGCDFMVFSGHKMLAPSGVGILYGRDEVLGRLVPARFGGGMVDMLGPSEVRYKDGPHRFEAGTPAIENVIGLGRAVAYIESKGGIAAFKGHLDDLQAYAFRRLSELSFIDLPFARAMQSVPIFSFRPKKADADLGYIARILSDTYGIAVNAGYQCCQPLYRAAGVRGAIRASFYVYNTRTDADALVRALREIRILLA